MTLNNLTEILKTDVPSIEIKKNENEIFHMIPELEICKGFDQCNEWHPYDVYEHTLHVIDGVENNEILRMSALFHDLGKPETFELDKYGIGHFFNYWFVSKEIFEKFADEYNYDIEKRNTISKLITYHDLNLGKIDRDLKKDILKIFSKEELIMLYKLKRADLLAQNPEYHYLLDEYDKQEKKYIKIYERKNQYGMHYKSN